MELELDAQYREIGAERSVDKHESSTFSLFVMTTNGVSIESMMSVAAANKRACVGTEANSSSAVSITP
jgi:hypothetical protein